MPLAWLPKLVLLKDSDNDWNRYLESIYGIFRADFIEQKITFDGRRVGLKRHPIESGKESTFWHFISDGETEADREINLRRCERIGWPRAIIDNCNDGCLKTWSEYRGTELRIHIWCETAEYLLVLADRREYVLPWTAYPVYQRHAQKKLLTRWKNATEKS